VSIICSSVSIDCDNFST